MCFFSSKPKTAVLPRPGESVASAGLSVQKGGGGMLLEAMWGLSKLAADGPKPSHDMKKRPRFADSLVLQPEMVSLQ